MGNSSGKPQNSSGISRVVINYRTASILEVHKVDGKVVKEGDEVELQMNIIKQSGGVVCFVEQQFAAGMEALVAKAIDVRNHLQECSFLRGEISRIIKTHVVELVRSVKLFVHFYERGNSSRAKGYSKIAFNEIKDMRKKLKDIQEHLELRTKEHSVSSFFSELLKNIKFTLDTFLGKDAKFTRNHIQYIIRQLTAQAHLRNQLNLLNNKVNTILDPTAKVEQGLVNLHSTMNEMSKMFYLPILKKHNALLESLLRNENYEVERVDEVIRTIEDEDRKKIEALGPARQSSLAVSLLNVDELEASLSDKDDVDNKKQQKSPRKKRSNTAAVSVLRKSGSLEAVASAGGTFKRGSSQVWTAMWHSKSVRNVDASTASR